MCYSMSICKIQIFESILKAANYLRYNRDHSQAAAIILSSETLTAKPVNSRLVGISLSVAIFEKSLYVGCHRSTNELKSKTF